MKKILIATVLVGSFLFAGAGPALATLVSYTDYYSDPGGDFRLDGTTGHDTINFIHDIASEGYSFPPDILEEATLTLLFRDDSPDPGGQSEGFKIQFDLGNFSNNINLGDNQIFNVLTQVKPDGLLRVVINHQHGDFLFVSSELYARWDDLDIEEEPTPTPEPASMLLLGTGLVGFAGIVRNKKKKQI